MSATARAHTFGRSLTGIDKTRMPTNVSPSISPDGRHIVFFSSRDLFSIDLYLAETATGRIVRKLVDTAQDSHFTSLQFISSAGSWSPDSRRFVVGGVHAGKAVLAILNIADGDVAREIEVPQVGEILNPTWSPTRQGDRVLGHRRRRLRPLHLRPLRSAGCSGNCSQADYQRPLRGYTTRMVARRKHDRIRHRSFHDERRAARPRRIRLAVLDVALGPNLAVVDVRPGQEYQPQWAPDSRNLFFVSDQNGISNVYRVNLQSGALSQVTNIDSGISGITALSPSISSAIDSRTLAISAYEDSGHHIYVIDAQEQLAGVPLAPAVQRLQAASLPPLERESLVAKILSDPSTGLGAAPAEVVPYKGGLSPTPSASRTFGGIDRFGGMVGAASRSTQRHAGQPQSYAQVSADTTAAAPEIS